jgi:hypothetical protein
MYKLRAMSERNKFRCAFGMLSMYQQHVLPFVEGRIGYEAAWQLQSVWQAGMAPIRTDLPEHEKYANAHSNWLWVARCSHDFLADLLDRNGVADYKRLLLRLYKRQHDRPDLIIYRMLKSHISLSRKWAYGMQWVTPIEITSRSRQEVSCMVEICKVLQTPASQRICRVDCQNVGRVLAREVYHLKRTTNLTNHGCTITLTPIADQDN